MPRRLERAARFAALVGWGVALGLAALACDATSTSAEGSGTPCTRDGDCASALACIAGICSPVESGPSEDGAGGDAAPLGDGFPD